MNVSQVLKRNHKLIIVLMGLLFIVIFNPFALEKKSLNKLQERCFTARILKKYYTIKKRQRRFIEVENIESGEQFYFFSMNNNKFIYEIVEVGDTIIKKANSFQILVKNGEKRINCYIGNNSGTKFSYE